MQDFPLGDELSALTGDSIVSIALGSRVVTFRFNHAGAIVVEDRFDYVATDGTVWPYDCGATPSPPFVAQRVLNLPIEGVEREDRRLVLRFDDGARLVLYSGDTPFESGHFEDEAGEVTAAF